MLIEAPTSTPNASCVNCHLSSDAQTDDACHYAKNATWREWSDNAFVTLSNISFEHNSASSAGPQVYA